jgi:lipoprotein-anchoring transpeptidase ErfK/SrfK
VKKPQVNIKLKRALIPLLLIVLPVLLSTAVAPPVKIQSPNNFSVEFFLQEYQRDFHSGVSFKELVFVSIKQQKLYSLKEGKVHKKYNISTSRYGVGSQKGSKKTPVGLHKIQNKIGIGCPENSILKMGYCSGKIATVIKEPVHGTADYVTTRIMWLNGMEKGVNKGGQVDTYDRNIYIHGTTEEGLIGKPASHGCVRMKNAEVIELFNKVNVNCLVLILDH